MLSASSRRCWCSEPWSIASLEWVIVPTACARSEPLVRADPSCSARSFCEASRGDRSGCGSAPIGAAVFIFEQDATRWRVDIVELARANHPDEGTDGDARERQRKRQDEIEDRHQRNAFDRSELARTVSELSGMTAAAISGWMRPLIASAPATTL